MIIENQNLIILKSISLDNKYTKWYTQIITNSLIRSTTRKSAICVLGYVEGHHIVPKSFELVNKSDTTNIAYLSAREHLICHWLLIKMFDNSRYKTSCKRAFHSMTFQDNGGKNKRCFPKHYDRARRYMAESHNEEKLLPSEQRYYYDKNRFNKDTMTREEFRIELKHYCDSGLTVREISDKYPVSYHAIYKWLQIFDLPCKKKYELPIPLEKLVQDMCLFEISQTYKISVETLYFRCKTNNLLFTLRNLEKFPHKKVKQNPVNGRFLPKKDW